MKKVLLLAIAMISIGFANAQQISDDFVIAVKTGNIENAKTFISEDSLDGCFQSGRREVSMLVFLLQIDNKDLLEYAVEEKNASINQVCGDYTALIWAARNGRAETVSYLLEQGADKSISVKGKTALDWANYYKRTEIIKLLK